MTDSSLESIPEDLGLVRFQSKGILFPGLIVKSGLGINIPNYYVVLGKAFRFGERKSFGIITSSTDKILCYNLAEYPQRQESIKNFGQFEIELIGLDTLTEILLANDQAYSYLSWYASKHWGMDPQTLLNQVSLCFSLYYPNVRNPFLVYKHFGLINSKSLEEIDKNMNLGGSDSLFL